jgi:hypothetical protein
MKQARHACMHTLIFTTRDVPLRFTILCTICSSVSLLLVALQVRGTKGACAGVRGCCMIVSDCTSRLHARVHEHTTSRSDNELADGTKLTWTVCDAAVYSALVHLSHIPVNGASTSNTAQERPAHPAAVDCSCAQVRVVLHALHAQEFDIITATKHV